MSRCQWRVCAVMMLASVSVSHAQVVASNMSGSDAQTIGAILAREITLHLDGVSLDSALGKIAESGHIHVSYRQGLVDAYTAPVSVHATNTPVGIVFNRVLSGTGLKVIGVAGGRVAVVPVSDQTQIPVRARQPLGSIAGKVVDSVSGRGLGGATVKLGGIKLSATTTDSGHFLINGIPSGDYLLTVRLFGYRVAERTVTVADSERVTMRVALVSVPNVLSGVVTTATGVQRKLEVGNDITTLNADSIRRVAPITSVTDLLEARVPGLTVLHSSGVPGDPARIRLRGASSISENNDPIVIVDGVRVYAAQSDARNNNLAPVQGMGASNGGYFAAPSPLDQLDPNSIETIEVFKGPSASSLYGADAANGVIVITTKRGRAGPTHWNVGVGTGLNYMPGDWPLNYYRFGYGQSSRDEIGTPFCAWDDLSCTVDSIVAFQGLNDRRYTLFADHGSDQTGNLTVSGGVPTLLYSLSGSGSGTVGIFKLPAVEQERYEKFYHQSAPQWMLRPNKYTTYGGTGQLTAQPSRALQVTVNSSVFQSNQQRSSLENGVAQLEGTYVFSDQLDNTPLISGEFLRVTDSQLSWTNGLSLSWQPAPWLPLTATAGFNSIARTDESLVPFGIDVSNEVNRSGDTTGYYGLGRGSSLVKTLNIGTTLPLMGNHVTAAVGGNIIGTSTADFTAATSLLTPGVDRPSMFPTVNATGGTVSSFQQSTLASSTYGWYVEPRLNVLSKLFVSPGFRLDGGSASGANAGLTGFPKIDLSYVAVDRQGERPLGGILSLLRPRFAFGYAGVQPGPADKLRLFSSDANNLVTSDGTTFSIPVTLTSLGNTTLRPERSSELEGGFETELWNGRLGLTVTQSSKVRHDAIIQIPVAASVDGAAHQLVNIGVIHNTGTELSFNAQLFETRRFAWNINTQVSHATSRVVRLNPGFQPLYEEGIVPGYPLFSRWTRPIAGYADANADGIIESNEVRVGDSLVYVGTQDPNYQLTANTGITFGGWLSINATVAYVSGLNQFNVGGQTSGAFALLPNTPGTSLVTEAAVVAANNYQPNYPERGGSLIGLMQTVNTLRFQDLSVNYNVPSTVSRRFRAPNMTVALQGSNLGLHTNYRGKDPNVNALATSAGGDQVQDTGQLPQPRTWWLRITLGN